MSERESQRTDDLSVDVDAAAGFEEPGFEPEPREREDSGGIVHSLYSRTLGRVLSTRGLVAGLVLTALFAVLFGLVPLVGLLGQLLGIGVAGFVYGLVAGESRYLELALSGALVGTGSALLGNLLVVTLGSATALLGFGLFGGALAAVVGHYFGRDLRDGLSREL